MSDKNAKAALAIFEAALDVPREERTRWIEQACHADPDIAAEARSLLAAHDEATEFLDDGLISLQRVGAVDVDALRSHWPGRQLGDFLIERQIGAGGMGIVYRARQISLNRLVALKMLPPHLRTSESARIRFQREVEAAARLRHRNIVSVYTTGEEAGTAYYAMELIDGAALNHSIEKFQQFSVEQLPFDLSTDASPTGLNESTRGRVGDSTESPHGETAAADFSNLIARDGYFATVANWMAQVADGLSYAHAMGIIHRDIKPSNLLLSRNGEIHISDFGIARIAEEPGLTSTGDVLGTPFYMAPEQISASIGPIDERTDIYALGVTLYELLTMQKPFSGDNREQVISKILHAEPRPPRAVNRLVPRDLETICLEALEKEPAHRYESAGALADDLRRFVDGRPILARREGVLGHGLRWVRRHRAWSAALGGVLLLAAFFAYRSQVAEARWTDAEFGRVFETAQLAAIEGDLDRASASVAEAEKLGAPAAQLSLLRGQVALGAGRHQEACDELERAVQEMPESLAAHALLAKAYNTNQQRDKQKKFAAKLAVLQPATLQDYLLLGDAQSYTDIDLAISTLDEAIERYKNSVVARLTRGGMLVYRATETAKPADAEAALGDLRIAGELLEPNAVLLSQILEAQLVAATAYAAAGDAAGSDQHLAEAAALAEALKRFPDQFRSHQWRAIYFDYVGDDERAVEAWRAMKDHSITFLVLTLCRLNQYQEALALCDERRAKYANARITDFLRSFVLAATSDSPQTFVAAFEPQGKETMDAVNAQRFGYTIYCIAGDLDRARQLSRELRASSNEADTEGKLWAKIAAFNCGELEEDALLAAVDESRPFQCEAHYFIGLTHLAQGDRQATREHLNASSAFKIPLDVEGNMGRAIVAQLDREPSWPPWIKSR